METPPLSATQQVNELLSVVEDIRTEYSINFKEKKEEVGFKEDAIEEISDLVDEIMSRETNIKALLEIIDTLAKTIEEKEEEYNSQKLLQESKINELNEEKSSKENLIQDLKSQLENLNAILETKSLSMQDLEKRILEKEEAIRQLNQTLTETKLQTNGKIEELTKLCSSQAEEIKEKAHQLEVFINKEKVRPSPYEEYFQLSVQSAKLNSPKMEQVIMTDTSGWYEAVVREKIAFNHWYNWIFNRLHPK
eukprot:TRINITY_DN9779_c0_g1_i1.p1 TRINITY_DN9779_c0_g1~~TRINITY_DN9779_c0_g1_i1.p1  ORF type:complete len:250 (+),score=69.81 TRINITY_DN9779_c0_g1_i1:64-813(+)